VRHYALGERLKRSALALIPGLKDAGTTQSMGRRAVTPDYLPVIGRAPRHPNVIFAFGHRHSGYNPGPATGRLVGEITSGRTCAYRLCRPNVVPMETAEPSD